MDKITRTLLLYSRLIKGEKVNKFAFCMETDCIPRTFDRDIEDVRLYLSETFDVRELRYDRQEKVYYLSGVSRTELETVEYQLIERILLDTGILRRDELEGLLQHVLSNTEQTMNHFNTQKELFNTYDGPMHKKALLKMHGDLALAIRNQLVIQIKYIFDDETDEEIKVFPCCLKYLDNYLYLIAFQRNNADEIPTHFRLDKIHSFKVERNQLRDEKQRVENYLQLDLERNKKLMNIKL